MKIEPLTMDHFQDVLELWKSCKGIGLSSADSPEGIAAFLERNPGISFIALEDGRVAGSVLGGYDGRRGFLYHLAVSPDFRRQGIGERLVQKALEKFASHGIRKSHVMVFVDNYDARQFWRRTGWIERDDISVFSRDT